MQTRKCQVCGTVFQLRANCAYEQKYCSYQCRRKAERTRLSAKRRKAREKFIPQVRKCEWCDKEFPLKLGYSFQKFCSPECQGKHHRRRPEVMEHRNEWKRTHPWKGKRKADANYKDKIRFKGNRQKALERDMDRCTTCGNKSGLVIHHMGLKVNGEYPDAKHELKWLTTLCRSCHAKIHMPSILEGQRKKR